MSDISEADGFEEKESPADQGSTPEAQGEPPARSEGSLPRGGEGELPEDSGAFAGVGSPAGELLASLQQAVDRLTTALADLEGRLEPRTGDRGKPQESAVEVLLPQGGVVEVPIKLRVETEDSRQLALLQELHAQRERLQEELAAAQQQIERLGKTQFKSTHVMEAMRKSTEETVAELRAALEARDRELAELRRLAEEVRKEYQLHLAQELLRIVDGLERSQQEAERLRASLDAGLEALRPRGWWGRWQEGSLKQARELLRERQADLASWQEGLGFVQQRLLALLADAGVEPMVSLDRPFDPHRQVAVGRVSDPGKPENWVVEEQLKGYLMGDRVLRFAEVVVNKVDSGEDLATQL
jgi:molecular chaperone GrpE